MRFRIVFPDGSITGEESDPADIAVIEGLRGAYVQGNHWLSVGLDHGRTKTVGDIVSMEIDGVEVKS